MKNDRPINNNGVDLRLVNDKHDILYTRQTADRRAENSIFPCSFVGGCNYYNLDWQQSPHLISERVEDYKLI